MTFALTPQIPLTDQRSHRMMIANRDRFRKMPLPAIAVPFPDRNTGRDSRNKVRLMEVLLAAANLALLGTTLAVLTGVTIPTYSNDILRKHLVYATNGLSSAAAQMEQFFQDYRSYAQVGASPNPPCSTPVTVGDFQIACLAPPSASAYLITATGQAGTLSSGFVYKLDNLGNQASVAGPVWNNLACPMSWILKPQTC